MYCHAINHNLSVSLTVFLQSLFAFLIVYSSSIHADSTAVIAIDIGHSVKNSLFISQKTAHKKDNTRLAYHIADSLLKQKFSPSLHHAMPIKGENRRLINRQRGIYAFPELAVLRRATMPAILVECGVIINKDEEVLLADDAHQKKIVTALTEGIVEYLKTNNKN